MTKGIIVTVEMLGRLTNCTIQLFNQHRYELDLGIAKRVFITYENGKPTKQIFPELNKDLDSIYSQIKIVFDPGGKLVMLRPNYNSLLKTTRENQLFRTNKNKKKYRLTPYDYYIADEKKEQDMWVRSMKRYWYNKPKAERMKSK